MVEQLDHPTTPDEHKRRQKLAPGTHDAFTAFSKAAFADAALDEKTKQLIAEAVAHTTQCPYCIEVTRELAVRSGASPKEVIKAILGGRRDAGRRRLGPLDTGDVRNCPRGQVTQ